MRYIIYPARPVPRRGRMQRAYRYLWRFRLLLGMTNGSLMLVVVGMAWISQGSITHGAGQQTVQRQSNSMPRSWLKDATILTVYGRAFHTAPVLGELGVAQSFDDLARQTAGARQQIRQVSGRPIVRMAVHLIYGLAVPCWSADDRCLLYLDDGEGVDLVRQYIEPAAHRGWLVILDDQLGRSNPAREMNRLREKGYLAHDNVEVAFDPEFRALPSQERPGTPLGQVTAEELDRAERIMDETGTRMQLAHRKLLLVHQWTPEMVQDLAALSTERRYVQPSIVMDGIGPPSEKAGTYSRLLRRSVVARGVIPGIKLFSPNPYDSSGSWDSPVLTWPQLLAGAPIQANDGSETALKPVPRIIVLS